MKKKHLNIAVAGLLLALPGMAPAEEAAPKSAGNLSEAFTMGEVAGHLGLYGQQVKQKGGAAGELDRFGFAAASASLTCETAPFHGLSLGFGAWGNTRVYQRNDADENPPDGDYRAALGDDALIHQAFFRYQHEGLGQLTVGRQESDLAWLTDYIQGVAAQFTLMEGFELTLGWAKRQSVVEFDEVSRGFGLMNGNRGLYFLDVKYTPVEGLELSPYYYHADELFKAPGIRASYTFTPVEGFESVSVAQYVSASAGQEGGLDDGDFLWLSQDFSHGDAAFGGGYLVVDRRGSGGIESFGDQQPFEDGNRVFEADARTWYLTASRKLGELALGLLYGQTRYLDGEDTLREKELDLSAEYEFIKGLSLGLVYVKVDHDDPAESYQAVKSLLTYQF